MKKILNSLNLFILSIILVACTSQKNEMIDNKANIENETVIAKISLHENVSYFKDSLLSLSLYEYNPMIADVPATLIYSKSIEVSFTRDSSSFPLKLEVADNKTFKENRKYYLVARVYHKKQKLHGYENGTEGFIRVIENKTKINIVLK